MVSPRSSTLTVAVKGLLLLLLFLLPTIFNFFLVNNKGICFYFPGFTSLHQTEITSTVRTPAVCKSNYFVSLNSRCCCCCLLFDLSPRSWCNRQPWCSALICRNDLTLKRSNPHYKISQSAEEALRPQLEIILIRQILARLFFFIVIILLKGNSFC